MWAGLGAPLDPRGQLSADAADAGGGGSVARAAGELRVWGPGAAGVRHLRALRAQLGRRAGAHAATRGAVPGAGRHPRSTGRPERGVAGAEYAEPLGA